jgi:hypothetical protein
MMSRCSDFEFVLGTQAGGHLVAAQGLRLHVRLLEDAAAGAHKCLRQAVHELERVELRAAGDLQAPADISRKVSSSAAEKQLFPEPLLICMRWKRRTDILGCKYMAGA